MFCVLTVSGEYSGFFSARKDAPTAGKELLNAELLCWQGRTGFEPVEDAGSIPASAAQINKQRNQCECPY